MKTAMSTGRKKGAEVRTRRQSPYFSRAVEKALLALDFIRESPQPVSLQQVQASIGLGKASAFRLLHTLEALHHISKSPDGLYSSPSPAQHQFTSRALHQMLRLGPPLIERLAMEFRETASIAAMLDNHIEVLAVAESPQLIRMVNTPGRILPPNASSLGKVITAFQPQELAEKLLRSYGSYAFTTHTITDEIALRCEFERIRKRGFAEDREESTTGARCFAAPILRSNGFAAGAVSLSMPTMRFQGEEQARAIVTALHGTAAEIQTGLADF